MRPIALLALALSTGAFAQKLPFDASVLMKVSRVADPQLSPDGKTVAFTVTTVDTEANKKPVQIFTVSLAGGTPRQLTHNGNNDRPRWSPDSSTIAFISDRGGSPQIWLMKADGSEPKQLTTISTEAGGVMYSPDGQNLLFTSDVYPECATDACNKGELDAEKANPVKARIYDSLLYRHWTHWRSRRRSHLFAIPVAGGIPRDLTPGQRDVPPFSLGGPDGYAVAPDGLEVCFTAVSDDVEATSTNTDLFVVPMAGGNAVKVTVNPAADSSPQYSPDGRYLAYRAQFRPGYESDRWRLVVLERATGKVTNLTESLDRWVSGFRWSPESARLFFTAADRGRQAIQFIPVTGGGARIAVSGDNSLDDMQVTPDGKTMTFTQQDGSHPVEIYRADSSGGSPVALTRFNELLLDTYPTTPYEEFWVEGTERARVQGFLVRPPNFDPRKKYPALLLIHGGPQGAWDQTWSYRWNAQVFASAGFVVAMANPRGSTGFGQKFIDEINGDWGGRAFEDLLAVADHLAGLPFVDGTRMAAAGGSYGGYMVNWMLGHTERFRAFVSHAGVFDLRSEATETEELWFPNWEFGGMPWVAPEIYARWSPSFYVSSFKTPTLVIHGEQDFRVPYGQGLQLFTALQMQKVPSRLLVFPDEGHWVLKPRNSLLWYKTFIDWIQTWVNKSE